MTTAKRRRWKRLGLWFLIGFIIYVLIAGATGVTTLWFLILIMVGGYWLHGKHAPIEDDEPETR